MNLREAIEAKKVRKRTVPILISDPTEDQEALLQATAALGVAEGREDEASVEQLRATAEEAAERVRSHWAPLELRALPSPEWEAATSAFTGEDGINWDEALPLLLSVSCTDESVQDEDWWRERLAEPGWSDGDKNVLRIALLRLNTEAADAYLPKD